jgi:hypothetical protein
MPDPAKEEFTVGDRVRVRPGVTDVMSSDMVLGGWTGAVAEIDGEMCCVRWDEETLAKMPSSYREHWQADALPVDSLWLSQRDLEPFCRTGPAHGSA